MFDFSDEPSNDADQPARRRHRRWVVDLPAYLEGAGTTLYCLIYDISPAGARVRVVAGEAPAPGGRIGLDLEGYGQLPAVVRHSSADVVGLEFLHDDDGAEALAGWLVALRPARRQARHRCRLPAALRVAGEERPCLVVDLSRSGAAVRTRADGLRRAAEVTLLIPGAAPIAASIRHLDDELVGLLLIDGYQGELPPGG